jgi:hypothetical protein
MASDWHTVSKEAEAVNPSDHLLFAAGAASQACQADLPSQQSKTESGREPADDYNGQNTPGAQRKVTRIQIQEHLGAPGGDL